MWCLEAREDVADAPGRGRGRVQRLEPVLLRGHGARVRVHGRPELHRVRAGELEPQIPQHAPQLAPREAALTNCIKLQLVYRIEAKLQYNYKTFFATGCDK